MSIENLILEQSCKEYDKALKHRSTRVTSSWHPNEDLYYGRKQKKLRGRHNVLLGEMQGFIETLVSKIDDAPFLVFQPTDEADVRKAEKVTKAWEQDSSVSRGDWKSKDLMGKKLGGLYGRAVFKYFASSEPEYSSNLVLVDNYDFLVDPLAGGETIEEANYMGQDNIFKTIKELEDDERYDDKQVVILKMSKGRDTEIDDNNSEQEKQNKSSLIVGRDTKRYQSEETATLVEWYTTYEGTRYICTYDRPTKTWIRVEKLKEVFTSKEYPNGDPLWPFDSWAFFPDPFEFWTPSPADQVRDTIISKNILINQALDNRQYRNFGMKAYDTRVFKNPALLEPRWAGLVPATPDAGKDVRSGIYEFNYPDVGDTTTLYGLVDSAQGRNSGITAGSQGATEKDKKVGVFEGELAQTADRLGLFEKSYGSFWIRIAKRYLNGLKEHMGQSMAIKMLGEQGVQWDELIKDDLNPKYDIATKGLNAELQADSRKRRSKFESLNMEIQNPLLNPKTALEKRLEIAGFEREEIRELMNISDEGNSESVLQAAEENEKLLKKDVEPNEYATPLHVQKHLDFMADNELKGEVKDRILAHAKAEVDFARTNMVKSVFDQLAEEGSLPSVLEDEGLIGQELPQTAPQTPNIAPEGLTGQGPLPVPTREQLLSRV
jgi:hypothetical protein